VLLESRRLLVSSRVRLAWATCPLQGVRNAVSDPAGCRSVARLVSPKSFLVPNFDGVVVDTAQNSRTQSIGG
jgi:hypothetical protein